MSQKFTCCVSYKKEAPKILTNMVLHRNALKTRVFFGYNSDYHIVYLSLQQNKIKQQQQQQKQKKEKKKQEGFP